MKYYKCFSINMLRFIKVHGIKPVSKGIHPNGKTYWVFEVTDALSEVLATWTSNKQQKEQ